MVVGWSVYLILCPLSPLLQASVTGIADDTAYYTASDDEVVEVVPTVEELNAALVLARRREYELNDKVTVLERTLEHVLEEKNNALNELRDLVTIALMHRDGIMTPQETLETLLVMLD